jgi:hypothetical protein
MSMRHSSRMKLDDQKNWRWNDQAWSRKWIISNNLCKEQIWIAFFISYLTFRDKTQNTLSAYFRKQFVLTFIATVNFRWNLIKSCKRKRLLRAKKLIIVMFSKKSNLKTKRLFSFIIVCISKSLNTIQSFCEVKKRNRLTLKDFYHIFQNVIVVRQRNFELDFDYNSFSFKLSSSIISSQFFRKSTFDLFNDIDLFDLKIRSFFSLNKHVSLKQFISKQIVNSSRTQSFCNYERKYQNDFFIRDNAIKRFFRVSNITKKNERSVHFYEFLTLRRNLKRRAIWINWFNFNRNRLNFNHFRESSQNQDKQFQSRDDHKKLIKMQW